MQCGPMNQDYSELQSMSLIFNPVLRNLKLFPDSKPRNKLIASNAYMIISSLEDLIFLKSES